MTAPDKARAPALRRIDAVQRVAWSLVIERRRSLAERMLGYVAVMAFALSLSAAAAGRISGVVPAGFVLALTVRVFWAVLIGEKERRRAVAGSGVEIIGRRVARSGRGDPPGTTAFADIALSLIAGGVLDWWWGGAPVMAASIVYGKVTRARWRRSFKHPIPAGRVRGARLSPTLRDEETLELAAAMAVIWTVRPSALAEALGRDASAFDRAASELRTYGFAAAAEHDGTGPRSKLTRRGRKVFRQHVAALEQASARGKGSRPAQT